MQRGEVLGRRVAAALIDVAIIFLLLVVVAKTLGDEGTTSRSIWAETSGGPRAVFFLLTFAYFFGAEAAWGQTVGKRVMKLRVVGLDGARVAAGPAFVRNLVRVVDWLPSLYLIGAIAVLASGDRRQRLGDMAAKTKVVADDARPPSPPRDRPDDEDVLAQVMR